MNNYTELDKILHRQFLSNNSLTDFLFSRILLNSKKYQSNKNSYVFITGLARSGTTALLNNIYSSNEFGSMVYSYMPFILFPKLAKFFSNISINKVNEKERLHNDGIKINLNSPECLDEIFWIKSEKNFYKDSINIKINNENILRSYDYFLSKYMRLQKNTRMVIKNNNHHQRLDILSSYFSNSFFLLMFREPIYHSYSLLNQHKNFLSLQKNESFILEYMNLIGHREFGNGHVPFVYSNNVYDLNSLSNKLDINYWVKQWINTYKSILDSKIYLNKNILLISYRSLCTDYDLYKSICNKLKIKNNTLKENFKLSKLFNEANHNVNTDILKEANNIYKELNNFSFSNKNN